MDNVELFILRINESINTKVESLPDDPKVLYRKVKTAFPNLFKTIGVLKGTVVHERILKLHLKQFNIFMRRSTQDYKKMDVMGRDTSGNILFNEKGIFFEDLERVVTTKSRLKGHIQEDKIGTSSKDIEKFADVLGSSIEAVDGKASDQKAIVKTVTDKYEDFDRVVNSSSFKKKITPETYKKIRNK
jgi:hypothetical protein